MFFYSELGGNIQQSGSLNTQITLLASTSSLYMADACVGTSSQVTFTVTSTGNTVETVNLSDNSDQFIFSPSSFVMTGSVTSRNITVTFIPTEPWGLKTGILTLSASGGSVLNLAMSGNAVAVPLILTSSVNSITFPNTPFNSSTSQTFTVSAGGFSSVKEIVTVTDNSNQFSFSPSNFSLTGSGASRTITTTFSPTSTGLKSATLTLSSSGGNIKTISLQGTGIDQYYNNTSLLLRGDGANNSTSFIDSSANGFSISRTGNPIISTTQAAYGGSSMFFNGSSYLSVGDSDAFWFSGAFTIEAWVYISSYVTFKCLTAQWTSGSPTQCAFGLSINPSGRLYFSHGVGTSNIGTTATTTTVPLNQWAHIAATRDSAGTLSFFVNGVKDATTRSITSALNNSTAPLRIGIATPSDGQWFSGYIDDLRITNGVARYTSNFTPPAAL